MFDIPSELLKLLTFIVPGLVYAWVYYSFTAIPRPDQFERLIQALIWTFIIQLIVWLERLILEGMGRFISFGAWNSDSQMLASILTAIACGFGVAYLASGDYFYKFIRKTGFSSRSIHPNNLHAAFTENKEAWVSLQLTSGARLFCHVLRWPLNPQTDQFVVERIIRSYVDDPTVEDLETYITQMVIPAAEVRLIEFVKMTPANANPAQGVASTNPPPMASNTVQP